MVIERTYSTTQVAEIMQVKNYTVRSWLRNGRLRGININGRWRVRESTLNEFMKEKQVL